MSTQEEPPTRRDARRRRDQADPPRFRSGFATLRDLMLFIVGVSILVNEVFVVRSYNLGLIGLGVGLTGAPFVFGADERKGG